MQKHLQNLGIECWHHTVGRLGRSEPFICLYLSDPKSCDPLFTAMDELELEAPHAKRTVTFKPNIRPSRFPKLRLLLVPESEELRQICISVTDGIATVEMTQAGLKMFREALSIWCDGLEDYCLAPVSTKGNRKQELGEKDFASGELWFWGPYYDGP